MVSLEPQTPQAAFVGWDGACSHIEPVHTAGETSVADSVHSSIPLCWQIEPEAEGGGELVTLIDTAHSGGRLVAFLG